MRRNCHIDDLHYFTAKRTVNPDRQSDWKMRDFASTAQMLDLRDQTRRKRTARKLSMPPQPLARLSSWNEMQNDRQPDTADHQPDSAGRSRIYFHVPVAIASIAEPARIGRFSRQNLHLAKWNKGQDQPRHAVADPPPNDFQKKKRHTRPLA
jgi:hypothetical protein